MSVPHLHVSFGVKPETALAINPVVGHPGALVLVVGEEHDVNVHVDESQLRRIRDVIDEHLGGPS